MDFGCSHDLVCLVTAGLYLLRGHRPCQKMKLSLVDFVVRIREDEAGDFS